MVNIEEIYHKLTGVDINQQKLLWDERGKGYYGEFLVFCELYPHLPGNCKILMNINIPAQYGKTTEIDLLLIHETGIYVFEMKHYKGTIYGKPYEQNWTQYFRTAPNQRFRSPIAQNQYHIEALKKIAPGIPVHSFIVFTSNECDLKVECNEPYITVCTLFSLQHQLNSLTAKPTVLNMEQMDHLFRTLLVYSPTSQHCVTVEGNEIPFHEFISELCASCIAKEKQLETAYENQQKRIKIKSRASIITATLVSLACIVISIVICMSYNKYSTEQIAAAQQELAVFAQKFEEVQDFNNGDLKISKELVAPANVVLEESSDLENTTSFSCTLVWNGSSYGVSIGKNAAIIVMLKDGSIKEYPVFNSQYPYTSDYRLGKSNSAWYLAKSEGNILPHDFYNITTSDISYIKLSNLDIWTDVKNQPKVIASGYEIELYRAE